MIRFASLVRALALGGGVLAVSGSASAQAPLACPPCGLNTHCVDGACVPNGLEAPPAVPEVPPADAAPAPVPAPGEAVPPAGVEAAPPPARPAPAPTSRRRQRVTAPKPEAEEDSEVEHRVPTRTVAAWRKGMLIMPYVGFHAIEGIAASDYDAGLRIGGLIGARLVQSVSLNMEIATNFLSPKSINTRTPPSGHDLTIAFSPLFHGAMGGGEFVVGPKLGFWSSSISQDSTSTQAATQDSQTGWAFGFNMGAFGGITEDVALGGIVAYQMTFLSQSCTRGGINQGCSSSGFPPQILSFAVAAMF
jgi:hypothetical protein